MGWFMELEYEKFKNVSILKILKLIIFEIIY